MRIRLKSNQMFSSATKQITAQELQGSRPKMQKHETKDGVTTAYVLIGAGSGDHS